MGEVISVKELSCHDCARYVCNDASLHSRCCDQEECCQFDVETRPIKPPADEDLEIEMEVDNGCLKNVCCFLHVRNDCTVRNPAAAVPGIAPCLAAVKNANNKCQRFRT